MAFFRRGKTYDNWQIWKGLTIVTPISFNGPAPWLTTLLVVCYGIESLFKKITLALALRAYFFSHLARHHLTTSIYTDDSRLATGVAAAIYCSVPPFHCRTDSDPQPLRLVLVLPGTWLSPSFTIFSDSKSALQAFESVHIYNHTTWSIQRLWHHFSVSFCWVPAHVGISGNKKADQLAHDRCSLHPCSQLIPCSTYFPGLHSLIKNFWQIEWDKATYNKPHHKTMTQALGFVLPLIPNQKSSTHQIMNRSY